MSILTKLINAKSYPRRKQLDYCTKNAVEIQYDQLRWLSSRLRNTSFGKEKNISKECSITEFQSKIEISDYTAFSTYIDRIRKGEKNVIWDEKISYFAKSSGTTDAKSKYVPVTKQMLTKSHMQGPRDAMYTYFAQNPKSSMFNGQTLTLGGSHKVESDISNILTGDLSAILIDNTPWLVTTKRVPTKKVALMADFEQKVNEIYKEARNKNITSFVGVPSWNLVMMNKILELSGKSNILEVWENMELFIHGGMNFNPYREQYKQLIPSPDMHYMETYNASEGFFAIGDDMSRDDMLLMVDYGTFYEFLPLNQLDNPSCAVPLEGVKCGVNYAMIISSCNGLWRYMIGDTVIFTSTNPYRIKISGRTKHFVNAFGEELIVDNAEQAIRAACDKSGAEVREFSAAPIYMKGKQKGSHQWVIEFAQEPSEIAVFAEGLDKKLQEINSDYEAKRKNDTTLLAPTITVVSSGTFNNWMASKGKVGGQNKVPRLSNDREIIEQLIKSDKPCI